MVGRVPRTPQKGRKGENVTECESYPLYSPGVERFSPFLPVYASQGPEPPFMVMRGYSRVMGFNRGFTGVLGGLFPVIPVKSPLFP